jgi:hypothetical protein
VGYAWEIHLTPLFCAEVGQIAGKKRAEIGKKTHKKPHFCAENWGEAAEMRADTS